MSNAAVTVHGHGRNWTLELKAQGMVIGRSPDCDIVLDSHRVSRRHARIFQDPFKRWIVEDVGSRNGVWLADRRVEAAAVLHGDQIGIGPFRMTFRDDTPRQIEPDPQTTTATTITLEDSSGDVLAVSESPGALDAGQLRRLNEITERLSELTTPAQLYPEVCRLLAASGGGVAAAVRLPAPSQTGPDWRILACSAGCDPAGEDAPPPTNLHLSRRVLESARSGSPAVMASSAQSPGAALSLTIVDVGRPRAVLCAPMTQMGEVLDVLYLDVVFDQTGPPALDFVRAVARQTSLARRSLLLAEARAERRILDHQLALARDIQAKLVPSRPEAPPGLDVAVCYRPAMWVGGDYCDTWLLPDGRLAFAVGDVCGKGLAAAMVMANLQAALRATAAFRPAPTEVLDQVSSLVCPNLPDEMFITLFLAVFDPRRGSLDYVNAGHILPLLLDPHGPAELAGGRNRPLGVHEGRFQGDRVTIAPGAGLLIVTDGVTEAPSPGGELFGAARAAEAARTPGAESAEAIVQRLLDALADHRGHLPQHDDLTVLAMLYRGTAIAD